MCYIVPQNDPENCFGSPVQYGVPNFLIPICILLLMISSWPYIASCIPFSIWSIGTKQRLALRLAVDWRQQRILVSVLAATSSDNWCSWRRRLMRTSKVPFLLFFNEWGCSICSLYIKHLSLHIYMQTWVPPQNLNPYTSCYISSPNGKVLNGS